jgi:hypothetical protein
MEMDTLGLASLERFSNTYVQTSFVECGFFLRKKPLDGMVSVYSNWRTAIALQLDTVFPEIFNPLQIGHPIVAFRPGPKGASFFVPFQGPEGLCSLRNSPSSSVVLA